MKLAVYQIHDWDTFKRLGTKSPEVFKQKSRSSLLTVTMICAANHLQSPADPEHVSAVRACPPQVLPELHERTDFGEEKGRMIPTAERE